MPYAAGLAPGEPPRFRPAGYAYPMTGHVAHAEITVAATPERVWRALTDPAQIKEWMVGTDVETDWRVGSPISWRGGLDGKAYGTVLVHDEPRRLSMTHYSRSWVCPTSRTTTTRSPMTSRRGRPHEVTLTQDGNDTPEQAEQFSANWQNMLDASPPA